MEKMTKAQRVRLIVFAALFAVTLALFLLFPNMDEFTHWTDKLVPGPVEIILQGLKHWLLSGLLLFTGVLLGLEAAALFVKPAVVLPKGAGIAFRVIAAVMAAAALYWSLGTVFTLGPLPPMGFALWVRIFVTSPDIRYIWWGGLGVFTFLATR